MLLVCSHYQREQTTLYSFANYPNILGTVKMLTCLRKLTKHKRKLTKSGSLLTFTMQRLFLKAGELYVGGLT